MDLCRFQIVHHIGIEAEGIGGLYNKACRVKRAGAEIGAGPMALHACDVDFTWVAAL